MPINSQEKMGYKLKVATFTEKHQILLKFQLNFTEKDEKLITN